MQDNNVDIGKGGMFVESDDVNLYRDKEREKEREGGKSEREVMNMKERNRKEGREER